MLLPCNHALLRGTHVPALGSIARPAVSTCRSQRNTTLSDQRRRSALVALATPGSGRSREENENDILPQKLGRDVISSVAELRDHISWSTATIMRNDAASLDGTVRTMHLSIEDHVDVLYGKKITGVVDDVRWCDNYTMPGQFVGLRMPTDTAAAATAGGGEPMTAKRLFPLANSPYQAKRDSYGLDASIIELVADRESSEDEARLAEMGPGSQVEVSQVVGRGFASLFNSYVGVMSALEEGRPLLLLCVGTRGMVPMRALLNWTPVQAHATAHKVTALYVTKSSSKAAFITEWDLWRESGAEFVPLYAECDVEGGKEGQGRILELLDQALFLREGGFDSLGRASEASVLMSGLSGEIASQITKRLTAKGVAHERMLFCDYF